MTYGGVIFCYFREQRTAAARALRTIKLRAEYVSADAMRQYNDGKRDTPRYLYHGATPEQEARLADMLGEARIEYYSQSEGA